VNDVIIYAVNDGAVMHAWAKDQGLQDSDYFHFLGDAGSELTNALRMALDTPDAMAKLGNPRCKRFAMLIDDGIIKKINLGPPDEVSFAEQMLKDLE
jgi:2-Cys peroxiredoxin 5